LSLFAWNVILTKFCTNIYDWYITSVFCICMDPYWWTVTAVSVLQHNYKCIKWTKKKRGKKEISKYLVKEQL
jgi:hypothetical protein